MWVNVALALKRISSPPFPLPQLTAAYMDLYISFGDGSGEGEIAVIHSKMDGSGFMVFE